MPGSTLSESTSVARAFRPRRRALLAAALLPAICLLVGRADASDVNWSASAGEWSDPNCWIGGEPDSSSTAFVTNGGTAIITQPGETCWILTTGDGNGESGTVRLTSGSLSSGSDQRVGYSGTGVFVHGGGNNTVGVTFAFPRLLALGFYSGASGTYQLTGPGALYAAYESVGVYGAGTFTQSDGNNTVPDQLHLGFYSGSSGNYQLSGSGRVYAGYEFVGVYGSGSFTHSDGNNTILGELYLGYYFGSSSTYQLSGQGRLTAAEEYVGRDGNGLLRQTGGRNSTGYVSIGAKGRYELTGGVLQVSGRIDSNGILDLSAGTGILATGGPLTITGTGQFLLGGGVLEHTDPNLRVDIQNDGNVRITAGSHVLGSVLPVDPNIPRGLVRVDAGATLSLPVIRQSKAAVNGTLAITGGPAGLSILNSLTIASESNSAGMFEIQGGYLEAGEIAVGGTSTTRGGMGTFTVYGGGGVAVDGRLVIWSGSEVHLGAGTLVDSDPNHPYLDVDNKGTVYIEEGVYTFGCVGGPGGAATGTIVVESNATLWVKILEQMSLIIEPGGTVYLQGSDPNYPDMNVHNDGTLYTGYGPIYFGLLDGDGNTFIGWDEAVFTSLAQDNYSQAIPEPGTILLVGLGMGFFTARRGKRVSRL